MEFEVLRFSSQKNSTLGLLFQITNKGRTFLAYTLEDEARTQKVWGKTRIPAGRYKLGLRREGGFHNNYLRRYGSQFHKGMIHVQNVPGFEFILWHIGNTDDDTAGCLLLGDESIQNLTRNGFIGNSASAYQRVYPLVVKAMERNTCWVNYVDYDTAVMVGMGIPKN
jgi:hypothetical protein